MSRIDDVAQILTEVTGETIQILKYITDVSLDGVEYAIGIAPSISITNTPFNVLQLFDCVILSETDSYKETYGDMMLKAATWYPTGYTYSDRISFTVDSPTGFAVDDAITSGVKTGTCYKLDGSTMYLKDVVGTFANTDTITNSGAGTTTITSVPTTITYPESIIIKSLLPTVLQITGVWGL